jgi:hypothetical protein
VMDDRQILLDYLSKREPKGQCAGQT